jgi:hypothetical protein
VQLADAGGEVHAYSVAPLAPGPDRWAVHFARLDGARDYRVALTPAGSWSCACPDARYRARRQSRLCKHARAARGLYRILLDLTTAREHAHL